MRANLDSENEDLKNKEPLKVPIEAKHLGNEFISGLVFRNDEHGICTLITTARDKNDSELAIFCTGKGRVLARPITEFFNAESKDGVTDKSYQPLYKTDRGVI